MSTPIIIPMPVEPDRCPECNNVENVKAVCANCGYEYRDGEGRVWPAVLIIVLSVVFAVWFLLTMTEWLTYGNKTLVQVLVSQWNFIIDAIKRIW